MASCLPSRRPDDSFRSALAASNFLIETRPSARAFSDRGNLYETAADYAHAIADYTSAIELDPAAADAYFDRGLVHAWTDAYELAAKDLTRTIELKPGWTHAYFLRGNVHGSMGDHARAIADLTKAIELEPAARPGAAQPRHGA